MPANFEINNVTLDEGSGAGTTNIVFLVTRTVETNVTTTVNYTFNAGGTNAADFIGGLPTTGSITFAPGDTIKTISIPISRDFDIEGNEAFTVVLSNPAGTTSTFTAGDTGTGTITNDDTAGEVRITNVTIAEGNSGTTNAVVTVNRISGNAAFTATYATADGTATTAGADYTSTTGTLTFAGGQQSATILIPIIGDTIGEPDEQFTLNLTGATNGVLLQQPNGGPAVGGTVTSTIVISNDDSSYTIADNAVTEGSTANGATNLTFTVTRTGMMTAGATLNYTVNLTGTATSASSADFNGPVSGTVTFNAGSPTATFNVPILPDFIVEPNETFTVTLSSPSTGTIATATATGTINDDDTAGTVAVTPQNISVTEGADGSTVATITLARTGGTGSPFAVNVSTQDVTATAGQDYVAISNQTVNFGVGQNTATVAVTINRDFVIEGDELFLLNLSSPTNGATAGANGQITIVDNPVPTFAGTVAVNNVSVLEGNSSNTVNITLNRTGGGAAFSVNYTLVAGSATAGSDFTAATGTISFGQGENSKTIPVNILGDLTIEQDESFTIQLSGATNGVAIASGGGTVTIINDDNSNSGTVVNGNQFYVTQSTVLPADANYVLFSTQVNSGTEAINLTGNGFTQAIVGNYGNNSLIGGGGADTLYGLIGNDTFIVSDASAIVVENPGEGTDSVQTSVSYVLAGNAEVESFSTSDAAGTGAINLQGSTASQTITGNAGANIINGFGGNDTMIGLGGNDQYLVRGPGDVVIEGNGGGQDIIYTTVSYNLGVNEVEALSTVTQSDTTAIDLIGNFTTQTIVGNFGNNVLNGGSGGVDTLIGLRGDDIYAVGDSLTDVLEAAGEGTDTVVTSVSYALDPGVSVEVLAVQNRGGTAAINLFGNELSQTIAGNEGVNYIDGGAGSDALIGGGGVDTFAFTTALGATNVDNIVDFVAGTDRIGLLNSIFNVGAGGVTASNFVAGTAALDGDDRIIYNAATGSLFYDADGNGTGAAIQFALVTPGTALTAASFDVLVPAPTV